jgi:TonB-dependent SusC/RagA subfamily outer membrane receptor
LPIENNSDKRFNFYFSIVKPKYDWVDDCIKDASATQFGSRASNGVIIIQQKKGGKHLQ